MRAIGRAYIFNLILIISKNAAVPTSTYTRCTRAKLMHMDVFSVRCKPVCEIVANRCCVGLRGETGQELYMEFLYEVYMRSSLQKALREVACKGKRFEKANVIA